MRTIDELVAVIEETFPNIKADIRSDLLGWALFLWTDDERTKIHLTYDGVSDVTDFLEVIIKLNKPNA